MHKWYATYSPRLGSFYAVRNNKHIYEIINGKSERVGRLPSIKMHRVILESLDNMVVDHRNHNTLDNRKENLRACTISKNCMNRQVRSDNKLGLKGVSWHKATSRYCASISANGKSVWLGLFDCKVEAAKAYDKKAIELHGEFAYVNYPKLNKGK